MKKILILIVFLIFISNLNAQPIAGPFVGAVTPTDATFIIKSQNNGDDVKIELAQNTDFSNPVYTNSIISDSETYNFVKPKITGLTPNTKYYYRAIINNNPDKQVNSFITFPDKKDYNFSFGFGSCQQSHYAPSKPEIFSVIAKDSLKFWIQIGDWGYPDTTEKKYGYRFNTRWDLLENSYLTRYGRSYAFADLVISQMPVSYVYDDHDFAANNSDGSDPAKQNSIDAYGIFFPHYELGNPQNGLWQKFNYGDVDFFIIDTRTQRTPNNNALDETGKYAPRAGHSILAGYTIDGENQKDWLKRSLKESTSKWKVIVSSVMFNPKYRDFIYDTTLTNQFNWLKRDIIDKWSGYEEEQNEILKFISDNNLKNVIMLTGDSHSAYIDDGENSVLPEMGSSVIDVKNTKVTLVSRMAGHQLYNKGGYEGDDRCYGKVSFVYGDTDYCLMEIIDDKGKLIVSYKLDAK
jgi:alkaline phosphatase D